jgi:asparagine synthase (glutamine-hydrolysing)
LSATEARPQFTGPTYQVPGHWLAAFDPNRRDGDAGPGPLSLEVISGGAPQVAAEGNHKVIFDGWLYNRSDLALELAKPEDAGDALILLAAYRRFGESVIPRMKGRFALLIWDGSQRELVAARDGVGTFPLFHARRGSELLLSTGIDELVRAEGVPTALNKLVLAEHLAPRWPEMEDTYYEAIHRVAPGHVYTWGPSGRRDYRYWDPVPQPGSADWLCDSELDSFEDVFDEAVSRCLERGPAGVFLSGGLDSVSVAAIAADLSDSRGAPSPLALSIAFPHPDADEREVQRGVAAQLGLEQLMVPYDEAVGPAGRIGAVVQASAHRPVPVLGLWEAGYWRLLEEARERGLKVILTGGGGDEMLVPSPYLAADLLARRDFSGWWRLFGELRRSYPWTTPQMVKSTFWRFGVRAIGIRAGRRFLNAVAPSFLRRRWRRQITSGTPDWIRPGPELDGELLARAEHIAEELMPRSSSFYYDKCRACLDYVTASMEMERVFEDGRRSGVPIHEPYWDANLQEFLYRVPPEMLQQGGRTKGLVRRMLTRRFPELGFERQTKVIANEFASDIFVTEIPNALKEMGGAQALSELGIVDRRRLWEAIDRFASDPSERPRSFLLWHVLSLESWVRAHI